jgi:hypothetical protein
MDLRKNIGMKNRRKHRKGNRSDGGQRNIGIERD